MNSGDTVRSYTYTIGQDIVCCIHLLHTKAIDLLSVHNHVRYIVGLVLFTTIYDLFVLRP